jgi:hypothetical protein
MSGLELYARPSKNPLLKFFIKEKKSTNRPRSENDKYEDIFAKE